MLALDKEAENLNPFKVEMVELEYNGTEINLEVIAN
jgi:hypothetical protein